MSSQRKETLSSVPGHLLWQPEAPVRTCGVYTVPVSTLTTTGCRLPVEGKKEIKVKFSWDSPKISFFVCLLLTILIAKLMWVAATHLGSRWNTCWLHIKHLALRKHTDFYSWFCLFLGETQGFLAGFAFLTVEFPLCLCPPWNTWLRSNQSAHHIIFSMVHVLCLVMCYPDSPVSSGVAAMGATGDHLVCKCSHRMILTPQVQLRHCERKSRSQVHHSNSGQTLSEVNHLAGFSSVRSMKQFPNGGVTCL